MQIPRLFSDVKFTGHGVVLRLSARRYLSVERRFREGEGEQAGTGLELHRFDLLTCGAMHARRSAAEGGCVVEIWSKDRDVCQIRFPVAEAAAECAAAIAGVLRSARPGFSATRFFGFAFGGLFAGALLLSLIGLASQSAGFKGPARLSYEAPGSADDQAALQKAFGGPSGH